MFNPPRPNHSSASVPPQEGKLWSFCAVVLESILIVVILSAITWGLVSAYKQLTSEVFFPLKNINLSRPLIYGDFQEAGDIVLNHAQEDLLHIDAVVLADEIRQLSWVKQVKVIKHWPNTIEISIDERVPVVRWENEFLDQEGNRFSVPMTNALQELFILQGPDGYEQQVLEYYQAIKPWLIQQGLNIKQFSLDPRLVWHMTLEGDIDIILGRDHLNDRLKKLIIVDKKVVTPYREYIDAIDLRYQDGFSVRWKNGVKSSLDTKKNTKER